MFKNKYGSVQELRSTLGHLKTFKITWFGLVRYGFTNMDTPKKTQKHKSTKKHTEWYIELLRN